ncbi:putative non-specific serine/threonine protein kinase [Helianthus anomalus]
MNLEECESEYLRMCNCITYASLNISTGTGCLIWFDELIDMRVYAEDGSDTKYLATVLAIGSECEYVILGHGGGGCLEVAVARMVVGQWWLCGGVYYILKVYALKTCSLYLFAYKTCTVCVNDEITLIVNRLGGWS